MIHNDVYSLKQLNEMVRAAVEYSIPDEYWVEAELADVKEVRGHCYMDLIEKDESGYSLVARAQARCWRNCWIGVKNKFESLTGCSFRSGIKVMVRVYAQFHEAYGFSWIITDVNPEYTLGNIWLKRREIISALTKQGVVELNKQLQLPIFCQRIAVISNAGAAGYGDFYRHLTENSRGYVFSVTLFEAAMQGEMVESSIIAALDDINAQQEKYDCVVIIRGGGATTDLSSFDTLALAENVANFPLPIITGIGHDKDECVLDLISHTRVKTPTAAATLLIEHLDIIYDRLQQWRESISRNAMGIIVKQKARIDNLEQQMPNIFARYISELKHHLDMLLQKITLLDPHQLLKRGYSITTINGKVVKDPSVVSKGDRIVSILKHGTIESVVEDLCATNRKSRNKGYK